ncbi:hypothetical protein DMUE_4809 [Dictyocoela muelleri]|nr:hypothetical protein DMUE_4809 [Dictyocoela muelleri]
MMNIKKIREKIYTNTAREFVEYLMRENLLKKSKICSLCKVSNVLVLYKRNIDECAWRCMNKLCRAYKKYFSVRLGSFFEGFKVYIKFILNVVLTYGTRTPIHTIIKTQKRDKCIIIKIPKKTCG